MIKIGLDFKIKIMSKIYTLILFLICIPCLKSNSQTVQEIIGVESAIQGGAKAVQEVEGAIKGFEQLFIFTDNQIEQKQDEMLAKLDTLINLDRKILEKEDKIIQLINQMDSDIKTYIKTQSLSDSYRKLNSIAIEYNLNGKDAKSYRKNFTVRDNINHVTFLDALENVIKGEYRIEYMCLVANYMCFAKNTFTKSEYNAELCSLINPDSLNNIYGNLIFIERVYLQNLTNQVNNMLQNVPTDKIDMTDPGTYFPIDGNIILGLNSYNNYLTDTSVLHKLLVGDLSQDIKLVQSNMIIHPHFSGPVGPGNNVGLSLSRDVTNFCMRYIKDNSSNLYTNYFKPRQAELRTTVQRFLFISTLRKRVNALCSKF